MESMPKERSKPFHTKGFVSLLITLSFLVMVVAGGVLYISPKGRVAHWTGWMVAGLDKEQWSAVHMAASFVFVVAAGFHLYLNWASFWSYLKARAVSGLNLKRELALALVLMAVCVAGTIADVTPFKAVVYGRDGFQDYWEARSEAPPVPHTEIFTLSRLSEETGMSVETMKERLAQAGIDAGDPSDTIEQIGRRHGKTPNELFRVIEADRSQDSRGGGQGGPGMGYGKMTVEQACERAKIDVETGLTRLREAGVQASKSENVKSVAGKAGCHPKEIAEIIAGR
jgi:uncharacterized protein DUF4405